MVYMQYTICDTAFDAHSATVALCMKCGQAARRDTTTVRWPSWSCRAERPTTHVVAVSFGQSLTGLHCRRSTDWLDLRTVQSRSTDPRPPALRACPANFQWLFIAAQMMNVAGAEQSIIYDVDDADTVGGAATRRSRSNWKMFYWWQLCASPVTTDRMLLLYGFFPNVYDDVDGRHAIVDHRLTCTRSDRLNPQQRRWI